MENLVKYFPQISLSDLDRICKTYHVRSLSLFGSMLHQENNPESDIDLLVEFEDGYVPGFQFAQIQVELAQLFGRTVDLHTKNSLSQYFRDTVIREAVSVYGKP